MAQTLTTLEKGGLTFLAFTPPERADTEIWFATRPGGTSRGPWRGLNVDPRGGDDCRAAAANQELILSALDLPGIFLPRQVHGREIITLAGEPEGFVWGAEADAAVSGLKGAAVGVMTADCLPVMLYHAEAPVVAAVHAGWRGLAAGIIPAAVRFILSKWGGDAAQIGACLGPAIGPCCYETGREVADLVAGAAGSREVVVTAGGALRLDLAAAAERQLLGAGLTGECIRVASLCTACRPDLFYSYRRDGATTGRMVAVIVMRN